MTVSVEKPSRRAALGALAALAGASTTALTVTSALATTPALTPRELLMKEGKEFQLLADRFMDLFREGNEARDQERVARARFEAAAPLRPKKGPSKEIYFDIVRDEPPYGSDVEALQARRGKPKKPGDNPLGMRFKKSVLSAYHTLDDHPPWTKEGEIQRKIMGVSARWENALNASARETGYKSARQRRRVADRDVRKVIAELLKHKPKTIAGLQIQAAACTADPDYHPIKGSSAVAFLTSVIEFGNATAGIAHTEEIANG